jgi:cellulose synthase/poly-beta-1,6-N-acetylglucosamine synthase-like glycosyltransferase
VLLMILTILSAAHGLIALVLLLPAAWLFAEVMAALGRGERKPLHGEPGPIAVIVPAHNEEDGIAETLQNLRAQVREIDTLLVVADNCTDHTADIARTEGAKVVERQSNTERGKGYALQFALDHLRAAPPTSVIFADADCWHSDNFVEGMGLIAERSGHPIQALCLMKARDNAPASRRVAAFAWLMMTQVRMSGLFRLIGAARLTGAGEAFPWSIAQQLKLGSPEIVEDLDLAITLAKEGIKTIHVSEHLVVSYFPTDETAATVQRARWEQGSLRMMTKRAPSLAVNALRTRKLWKLGLALDILIPPLSLFMAMVMGTFLLGVVLACAGAWANLVPSALAALLAAAAVVIGWFRFGQATLSKSDIRALGPFVLSKFAVYGKTGRSSAKVWTRTPRDPVRGDEE